MKSLKIFNSLSIVAITFFHSLSTADSTLLRPLSTADSTLFHPRSTAVSTQLQHYLLLIAYYFIYYPLHLHDRYTKRYLLSTADSTLLDLQSILLIAQYFIHHFYFTSIRLLHNKWLYSEHCLKMLCFSQYMRLIREL